ncbi:hypothetical protein [Dyella sp. 20L07]|uniref:hypothetical protein n=1 Tax=Dyella sp. 20L07 TaxID=3384240 RepID=UPI003D268610
MIYGKGVVFLVSAFALVGCTSSNGSSAGKELQPSDSSTLNAGTHLAPTEFAHRYNRLAGGNFQVIEITGPGGVRGERWITLNLADKQSDIYTGEGSNIFKFVGNKLSASDAKSICTWMVQAFNPDMSANEAASMATSVIDQKNKVILRNTVLEVFPTRYEQGCEVSSTGL